MNMEKDPRHSDILGIIPARWDSARFPGKPLALINGTPMVIHVYRQAVKALKFVVIATDDRRIAETAGQYDAECIITSPGHTSGTSRCAEAANKYCLARNLDFKAVINIQGDEPLIKPEALKLLADRILLPGIGIATLIKPEKNPAAFQNPHRVKVVVDHQGYALYFSRYPIPFLRHPLPNGFQAEFYIHVGVYAFKRAMLSRLQQLSPGRAEIAESLEQLRWLEYGYKILCCESDYEGIGIDTPEDLEELKKSGII